MEGSLRRRGGRECAQDDRRNYPRTLGGLTHSGERTSSSDCKHAEWKRDRAKRAHVAGVCDNLCLTARNLLILNRRDVRVVEGARLESVCRGNSTEGSNPSLSAILLRSRRSSASYGGMGYC